MSSTKSSLLRLVLMDKAIMESLEDLWFFGNVFSLTKTTTLSDLGSAPPSSPVKFVEEEEVDIEEPLEPKSTIVEDHKSESEIETGNSSPGCGEVADVVGYYCPSPREKEQKRRRRRRPRSKRGLLGQRRRILGELDLGFGVKAEAVSGSDWILMEENFGFSKNQFIDLSDNMAMKEQLKTWAYAVACTVR